MKPQVIENVLTKASFLALNDHIHETIMWGNRSKTGSPEFWGGRDRNALVLFECASIVKLKAMKLLKRNLNVLRSQINGQTRGQEGVFHTDSHIDGVWTFILFTNLDWNSEWGGEFVHFTKGEYTHVPYIPNSGVLFNSQHEHRGSAPNILTAELRTSAAFMFAEDHALETAREENECKGQLF